MPITQVARTVEKLLYIVLFEEAALSDSADSFQKVGRIEVYRIRDDENMLIVSSRLREINDIISFHRKSIGI